MSQSLLPALEVNPRGAVTASVILLHGLGVDGHDFEPLVAELIPGRDHGVRFVLPHAPSRAVTVNGGMVMPAWYDILETDITARPDEVGIRTSAMALGRLIDRERGRGIDAGHIVVAGFSQGGAIALFTGLRFPRRLAGILALSAYLPLEDTLASEAAQINRGLSIFMGHGLYDPVVPHAQGSHSCRLLEEMGYAASLHSYNVEHTICLEEINDIGLWLQRVLPL